MKTRLMIIILAFLATFAGMTPTTHAADTSVSIVDFLAARGENSSFEARKALAKKFGIKNYSGTAKQNIRLLRKLQKKERAREQLMMPPATDAGTRAGKATGSAQERGDAGKNVPDKRAECARQISGSKR